ncbi:MAG: MBL fold metallo-hydrolase [Myxococcales bacterium]|nr:MBL fold metallo-hydrolase [Myxococcales bacterium]
MRRKLLIGVGVLLLTMAAAALYALGARDVPATSRHAIDLDAWRALAAAMPGDPPVRIRHIEVHRQEMPKGIVAASEPFGQHYDIHAYAIQVVYADGTTGIIDAINDEASQLEGGQNPRYFPEAFDAMQTALRKARWIVCTHEHFDHINGVANSPYFDEIIDKTVLTKAQLESPIKLTGITDAMRARVKPWPHEDAAPLAPGVVLIPAPSHTPGSQLVYVRLADGAEYLFVGDIAWNLANIRRPTMHPRAVEWALEEDYAEDTAHWLRAFHDLAESHPKVHQIVAHDGEVMAALVAEGAIEMGLE